MPDSTGEQDLVKALDNVAGATSVAPGYPAADAAQPQTGAVADPFPPIQQIPAPLPSPQQDVGVVPSYLVNGPVSPVTPGAPALNTPAVSPEDLGPLGSIKQDALTELRPLVDKLNVSNEEKFDTYLLLIRSTDDTNLIAPAYEAAKQIADETRRAEALLDIIKEIDYLSKPKEQ